MTTSGPEAPQSDRRTPEHSTRPLQRIDSDNVLRINATASPAVAKLDADELARLMKLSDAHTVVLDRDGSVVGYALIFADSADYDGEEFLAFRTSLSPPFVYVDQVAISSEVRRTGFGMALYAALQSAAIASGATSLCCEVNTRPPNPASLAFHSRLGFQQVGAMSTKDGRKVALFAKRLHTKTSSR